MDYTTFEIRTGKPHVGVHRTGCEKLRQHGGNGKGTYKEHSTLLAAREYARTTGLDLWTCSTCMPVPK